MLDANVWQNGLFYKICNRIAASVESIGFACFSALSSIRDTLDVLSVHATLSLSMLFCRRDTLWLWNSEEHNEGSWLVGRKQMKADAVIIIIDYYKLTPVNSLDAQQAIQPISSILCMHALNASTHISTKHIQLLFFFGYSQSGSQRVLRNTFKWNVFFSSYFSNGFIAIIRVSVFAKFARSLV